MKINCKCGNLVADTPFNEKYRIMTSKNWEEFMNVMDERILSMDEYTDKEATIMKIRRAMKSRSLWVCPKCDRWITMEEGNILSYKPDD